jgi:putative transposase
MALAGFIQGALIEMGGRRMALKREVGEAIWQIEDCRSGRIHEYPLDELRRQYVGGELIFVNDSNKVLPAVEQRPNRVIEVRANISPVLWEKAKIRRHYVMAVIDLPATKNLLVPAIRQAWQKLGQGDNPPHWTVGAHLKLTTCAR